VRGGTCAGSRRRPCDRAFVTPLPARSGILHPLATAVDASIWRAALPVHARIGTGAAAMLECTALENLLRRDRRVIALGLAATVGLSWAYQLYMAFAMRRGRPTAMLMPDMRVWSTWDLLVLFVMWVVMMVAMMTPSVAPTVLVFAAIHRSRRAHRGPFVATGVFLLGYLAVWVAFSLVATLVQRQLHAAALISTAMAATSPLLAGALLLAGGAFQWTPWKQACLAHCSSPRGFVLTHWREGTSGAFRVGLAHGTYCLGCCAMLMSLLFVNGVMNISWMAVLTAFVLVEKLVPARGWTSRLSGLALCVWGGWMLLSQ